jgi:hypothetical protein
MEAVLNRNAVCEDVYVRMPQSDMDFFQLFAQKMGWQIDKKQHLWEKFMQNSPQNVDLTEEEIVEEVRAVRYGKM